MRYRFINDHQKQMNVRRLCNLFHISRSAYYRWQELRPAEHWDPLLGRIIQIHLDSRQIYGSPRICRALRQEGYRCNHKRIARLMHLQGIRAKMVRRFKITTRSSSTKVFALDLVKRNFTVPEPNRIWTSDITYIWTREGWAYLAVVMDLHSRMIVGWEAGPRLTASLVVSAVKRALYRRQPNSAIVLHSDRGSQYASDDLRSLAKEQNMLLSMGKTGSCYDNAVTESFFHTLKTEHIYFNKYDTRQQAQTSIFDYIETFYNQRRLHSALGYLSPAQFENQLT